MQDVLTRFQSFQENKKDAKENFSLPDCLLTMAPYFSEEQWRRIISYTSGKERKFLELARKNG